MSADDHGPSTGATNQPSTAPYQTEDLISENLLGKVSVGLQSRQKNCGDRDIVRTLLSMFVTKITPLCTVVTIKSRGETGRVHGRYLFGGTSDPIGFCLFRRKLKEGPARDRPGIDQEPRLTTVCLDAANDTGPVWVDDRGTPSKKPRRVQKTLSNTSDPNTQIPGSIKS